MLVGDMAGNIELRKEKVDLATVVYRALETAQPTIDTQGHELTVSLPIRQPPIRSGWRRSSVTSW
jgi:hypothetical protein